jgi:hypothetical protein
MNGDEQQRKKDYYSSFFRIPVSVFAPLLVALIISAFAGTSTIVALTYSMKSEIDSIKESYIRLETTLEQIRRDLYLPPRHDRSN